MEKDVHEFVDGWLGSTSHVIWTHENYVCMFTWVGAVSSE